MSDKIYDLIIIGGGPAGFTAGIYAKRSGLDVALIEKGVPGGAVAITYEVLNYPGIKQIGGPELATMMYEHAESLGVEMIFDEVKNTHLTDTVKTVECFGGTFKAYTVIICIGAAARKLGLDNERQFIGKGISYCATCDGSLFKDKDVAIVGGGNTALEDAVYMSNLAKRVYLIHRRDEFRGDDILVNDVKSRENIELVLCSKPVKINGTDTLQSVEVENLIDKSIRTLDVAALFVSIGRGPDTEVIDKQVKLNDAGYIVGDEKMQTNVDGVYVAGDIRQTPLRQIVTACSDGAIAATSAFTYIKTNKIR